LFNHTIGYNSDGTSHTGIFIVGIRCCHGFALCGYTGWRLRCDWCAPFWPDDPDDANALERFNTAAQKKQSDQNAHSENSLLSSVGIFASRVLHIVPIVVRSLTSNPLSDAEDLELYL
jgi:hypothetical protein